MTRTLDQVNTTLDSVIARVADMDGSGLVHPADAQLAQVKADIKGLRTTLNQAALAMQDLIDQQKTELDQIKALVYQHLGLSS
jgi:hypothetical protein